LVASLDRDMVTKRKKTGARGQKLLDAANHAASCLREAGEPLHGLGPSQHYADAFACYSRALYALVVHECPLHAADWDWDGYEGKFHFWWEFGTPVEQPGSEYAHDTRFVALRCPAQLDPQEALSGELSRLRVEAEHYAEMRGVVMR